MVNWIVDCGLWGNFDFLSSFFVFRFLLIPGIGFLSRALQVKLRSFGVSDLPFCQRASAYVEKGMGNGSISTRAVDQ